MNKNYKKYILSALFSEIIAVLSIIAIPMPIGVPFTLQTFGIAFCSYFLGAPYCVISVLIYIAIGLAGVPVFSGLGAGAGVLFGITGGFIWGFLPLSLCCGFFKSRGAAVKIVWGTIGVLLCHAAGALQFKLIYGGSLIGAVILVSLPYLLKDILSVTAAFILANLIKKRIKMQ